MRKYILQLIIILIIASIICGCNSTDTTSNISNFSYNISPTNRAEIFTKFMNGEITAKNIDGLDWNIYHYSFLRDDFLYVCYDVDDDGENELCIKDNVLYIFDIKDNELFAVNNGASYSTVVNDGGILYCRPGGAPTHYDYCYYKLDKNGNKESEVWFSWYDQMEYDGEIYPKSYYINNQEVKKYEYDKVADKYLNIGTDNVVWRDIYDNKESELKNNNEKLLNALKSEEKIIDENGNEIYFNEYKISDLYNEDILIPEKYTYIDLNNDGFEELTFSVLENNYYIIFHIFNNNVYGYTLGVRQFHDLKMDGRFSQSGSAAITNISKIKFEDEKMTVINLAQRNDFENKYIINGESVTKEVLEQYYNEYSSIDNCYWHNIDMYTELLKVIDNAYDTELSNASSTAELCDVHIKYSKKWQEIADKYYATLIKNENIKPYIVNLKSDWQKYYKSQTDNYNKILEHLYNGGSITGVLASSHECNLQKEWAMQLVNMYEHI